MSDVQLDIYAALEPDPPTDHRRGPALAVKLSLDEKFAIFHVANPDVYRELVRLCRLQVARGRTPSIKLAVEQLRAESIETCSGDTWTLNNNHTARYAALIERNEPDLRFRHRRSA